MGDRFSRIEESTPAMTCLLEAGPPSLQALAGIQTENSPALKQHKGPEVAGETTKYDPAW